MNVQSVLVTGGAGYIGAPLCGLLADAGWSVRALDAILHGQDAVATELGARGVEVIRGDVRSPEMRQQALSGVDVVVHLAAIVGDPACARDPALSNEINVEAAESLIQEAAEAGVQRFVFASTCSNYGRMADPTVPIDEDGQLAPVSLYAEQKVRMERMLLDSPPGDLHATCLRFATIYGVAPRMRFDLTVNEFTRDLWADRNLEVFGEQFWRPYVHVHDAGRAVLSVLQAADDVVAGQVFNVGRSGENYRKLDLVEEIRRQVPTGRVRFVHRDEDPRDYKVSFDKIARELDFRTQFNVRDGIAELIDALSTGAFADPFAPQYRN